MGRKPPAALRPTPLRPDRPSVRLRGFSPRTREAIELTEIRYLSAGAVGSALVGYRRFLAQPGRWLYVPPEYCPCCDVREQRDVLDEVLRRLPPAARAELGRVVAALDVEYLRRTLPDPWSRRVSQWHASRPWWWHRLPQP